MTEIAAPLPLPDDDSAPYWEAAARGELRMQRCSACRGWRFPPRSRCARCQSDAVEWERVSGRGTVYSFVVAHAPVLPAFAARVPFAIVLVELDEDPQLRVVGNLLDVPARRGAGRHACHRRLRSRRERSLLAWRPDRLPSHLTRVRLAASGGERGLVSARRSRRRRGDRLDRSDESSSLRTQEKLDALPTA